MFNLKKKIVENQTKKITTPFIVGDIVKVCSDESKVKKFQNCKKCGGYSEQRMQCVLGKSVEVIHISQHCVKVEWENNEFDLHPNLIEIIGQKAVQNEEVDENIEVFFEAIEQGNISIVYEKITLKLLNMKNLVGRTPINIACINGHNELVETLIEFNADLDIPDNNGNRPIHNSTLNNYSDIIKLIIKHNKDQLYTLDNDGKTLLHIAIIQNNYNLTKYFLQQSIQTDIIDQFGKTAFQYMISTTNSSIKKLIIESKHMNANTITIVSEKDSHNKYNSQKSEPNYFHKEYIGIPIMGSQNNRSVINTIPVDSVGTQQPNPFPTDICASNLKENSSRQNECEICYSRQKKVAFVTCGHTSCVDCAKRLFHCHICTKEIIDTLVIYM